jgi:hypothetical protein
MSLGIIYKMDDLLIKEIKECDMMIKSHTKDLEDYQRKRQSFIDLQRLIQPEPEPPLRESRPFLDDENNPHLFLDDEGNTVMSREGSCDDDSTISSTAENCLIDEINNIKDDIELFRAHIDNAIVRIESGIAFIKAGCRASI